MYKTTTKVDRKELERVLVQLLTLLQRWGISPDDWILIAQYAWYLDGHTTSFRQRHLNLFVRRERIPWSIDIPDGFETHPPVGSSYGRAYESFVHSTGFAVDFIPFPSDVFEERKALTKSHELPNGNVIVHATVASSPFELGRILHDATPEGWGEEKGRRIYFYMKELKTVLERDGESKVAKELAAVLKSYGHFEHAESQRVTGDDDLHGIAAAPGKYEGVAHVITVDDISSIPERSVLVAQMTSPRYTAMVQKAGAIVTDEGGMLCHAAIVAREMGIPCVVGTKGATKVFKAGDPIHVDGDKGIVRQL